LIGVVIVVELMHWCTTNETVLESL